ncbi:Zn-dependent protease [Chitinivorax tropicus]|uniref:Zn-dependent protease n=1 Tax=Chitinivorax tropicus TaxID=714531 RepID=A0A840MJS7_9PROT|nr:site-2 protease family protein [Chitinivorax tropicus]MBB5016952.1 Zn-dependent protease [Chitinivorax tropicus]
MDELNLIQKICVYAIPVLFAITMHEAAHAYAAMRFGDRTAAELGRLSLNPIRHIDWVGTILLPMVCLALGGFLFGWAKPVPVDFRRLRHPLRDMVWVAGAGPASNLAMAIGWVLMLKLAMANPDSYFSLPLAYMAQAGVGINVSLMVLNLLPIPPLDGGRIAVGLLPRSLAQPLAGIEPYGMFILIGLMATGLLTALMQPLIAITFKLLMLFL